MGALRLILVLAAIWLVVSLMRRYRRPAPPPKSSALAVATVRCDHCGVFLPAAEAVDGEHGRFCCEAHRRAGRDRG